MHKTHVKDGVFIVRTTPQTAQKTYGKWRFSLSCGACVVAAGNSLKPRENEGFHVLLVWLQQDMYCNQKKMNVYMLGRFLREMY